MLVKKIKSRKYGEISYFVTGHWLSAVVDGEVGQVWLCNDNGGWGKVTCSYHGDSFDKAVAKAHRKICTGYGTVMKCVLKEKTNQANPL